MLRVWIDQPDPIRQKVKLVIDVLADGMGLPVTFVDEIHAANIVYAVAEPPDGPRVWIPASSSGWDDTSVSVHQAGVLQFFGGTAATAEADVAGDICLGTWILLTGGLEQGQVRNRFGVPIARGSVALQQGLIEQPLVSRYVHLLTEAVKKRIGSGFVGVPRWPGSARSAIVLSHDVDQPFSRPSASHYKRRIARDVRERKAAAMRSLGGYVKNVLLRGDSARAAATDPNFGFSGWRQFEESVGAKSAFYVAVRSSADPGALPEEVNYDFTQPAILDSLKRLGDDGWEIGLHASIACRSEPFRFATEKAELETALGQSIRGVRHHYWALDTDSPVETLKQHQQAGFEYDSSLAYNDSPGFRRGIAWPFNPIDPVALKTLEILEIPPTLMDGGIFYREPSRDEGEAAIRRHFEQTFEYGGAVVLDWHLEQQNPGRLAGAGPALMRVLEDYRTDSSIFWASPIQLSEWWQERRRLIKAR